MKEQIIMESSTWKYYTVVASFLQLIQLTVTVNDRSSCIDNIFCRFILNKHVVISDIILTHFSDHTAVTLAISKDYSQNNLVNEFKAVVDCYKLRGHLYEHNGSELLASNYVDYQFNIFLDVLLGYMNISTSIIFLKKKGSRKIKK